MFHFAQDKPLFHAELLDTVEHQKLTRQRPKLPIGKAFKGTLLAEDIDKMARRRYQQGQVYEHPKGSSVWHGRYYESVLRPDGSEHRIRRNPTLGKFATEKLARRALEPLLAKVNAHSYRPMQEGTWAHFSQLWEQTMHKTYKPSVQASNKSLLKVLAWFNSIKMSELANLHIQQFIAQSKCSPKTVKNQIAHMRSMWRQAKAWKYAQHNPFDEDLVLPVIETKEQPIYSPTQVRQIRQLAQPPYDTVFWVFGETGMRRGELCGLNVEDVNLEEQYIWIQRSRWNKYITRPKSKKPRIFAISDLLAQALKEHMQGRDKNAPLFLSPEGCRLHPENLVKRVLKPILKQLGLAGACHAFRHGNITAMNRLKIPPAVMQSRVGHADFDTTMKYMHVTSEDSRAAANALGRLYALDLASMEVKGGKQ